jgi:hypothetical protein
MADRHSLLREIVRRSLDCGNYHFTRKTLRFFGETLRSYYARREKTGEVIVYRHGRSKAGPKAFYFNYDTGRLTPLEYHRETQKYIMAEAIREIETEEVMSLSY